MDQTWTLSKWKKGVHGADPVGVGYIDNYRTIINERGVATIVQAR